MQQIVDILSSVGFNWHVALANFINFLIILFLLNRFFFGKLGKTIQARHEIIERGLSHASDAEKKLAQAEDDKKEILKNAKKESHTIISEAQTQGHMLAASLKEEAEKEIALRQEAMDEKEAALKKKVEKDFAEIAPAIVAKLYAETLKKNLTEKENDALIKSMEIKEAVFA
jgi:F-type H+-transporting ATPase subunit b